MFYSSKANSMSASLYSSRDADILNYRKDLIGFYETGDYSPYADYFLNKQVERIKEIE